MLVSYVTAPMGAGFFREYSKFFALKINAPTFQSVPILQ